MGAKIRPQRLPLRQPINIKAHRDKVIEHPQPEPMRPIMTQPRTEEPMIPRLLASNALRVDLFYFHSFAERDEEDFSQQFMETLPTNRNSTMPTFMKFFI